MKILAFDYIKKNGEKTKPIVLTLYSDEKYLYGIDLNKLNEKEQKKLKELYLNFEKQINKYIKGFRQYIKENINNTEEIL